MLLTSGSFQMAHLELYFAIVVVAIAPPASGGALVRDVGFYVLCIASKVWRAEVVTDLNVL